MKCNVRINPEHSNIVVPVVDRGTRGTGLTSDKVNLHRMSPQWLGLTPKNSRIVVSFEKRQ